MISNEAHSTELVVTSNPTRASGITVLMSSQLWSSLHNFCFFSRHLPRRNFLNVATLDMALNFRTRQKTGLFSDNLCSMNHLRSIISRCSGNEGTKTGLERAAEIEPMNQPER